MMKNLRTTILGIFEAMMIEVSAEALFPLTWKHRIAVIGFALTRATFGVLAADARAEKAKQDADKA